MIHCHIFSHVCTIEHHKIKLKRLEKTILYLILITIMESVGYDCPFILYTVKKVSVLT